MNWRASPLRGARRDRRPHRDAQSRMMRGCVDRVALALAVLCVPALGDAQVGTRRLTTIDALRQFPGYFHLQNVLLRGEFAEADRRILLKADENELSVQLAEGVTTLDRRRGGARPADRRRPAGARRPARRARPPRAVTPTAWPRPARRSSCGSPSVTAAPAPTGHRHGARARARAVAVRRTDGHRGRQLPRAAICLAICQMHRTRGATTSSSGTPKARVWVTGLRPRGRGFDLDVDRRHRQQSMARGHRARSCTTAASSASRGRGSPRPPRRATRRPLRRRPSPPPRRRPSTSCSSRRPTASGRQPAEPCASSSRAGLPEPSLAGQINASYTAPRQAAGRNLALKMTYDAANRAIEIRFTGRSSHSARSSSAFSTASRPLTAAR